MYLTSFHSQSWDSRSFIYYFKKKENSYLSAIQDIQETRY